MLLLSTLDTKNSMIALENDTGINLMCRWLNIMAMYYFLCHILRFFTYETEDMEHDHQKSFNWTRMIQLNHDKTYSSSVIT